MCVAASQILNQRNSRCVVTCRLSCLDEELLLLRDREEIFWDMLAKLRSSEPIVVQAGPAAATAVVLGPFFSW